MVEILERFSYYAIIVYLIKEIKVTCNIHPFMIVSASVSPSISVFFIYCLKNGRTAATEKRSALDRMAKRQVQALAI